MWSKCKDKLFIWQYFTLYAQEDEAMARKLWESCHTSATHFNAWYLMCQYAWNAFCNSGTIGNGLVLVCLYRVALVSVNCHNGIHVIRFISMHTHIYSIDACCSGSNRLKCILNSDAAVSLCEIFRFSLLGFLCSSDIKKCFRRRKTKNAESVFGFNLKKKNLITSSLQSTHWVVCVKAEKTVRVACG